MYYDNVSQSQRVRLDGYGANGPPELLFNMMSVDPSIKVFFYQFSCTRFFNPIFVHQGALPDGLHDLWEGHLSCEHRGAFHQRSVLQEDRKPGKRRSGVLLLL